LLKKYFPLYIIILVVFLDQALKLWVKCNYELGENIFSLGILQFDFVENPGMAFGLSFGSVISKYLLSLFRVVAVFAIGYYIIRLIKTGANFTFICLVSLIFSGALGNILDNVFYGVIFNSGTTWNETFDYWVGYSGVSKVNFEGYSGVLGGCVVDMVHLVFYWPEWTPFGLGGEEIFPPVFNLADACISISVFTILIFYKRLVRKEDLEFNFKKVKQPK
jgi:signal peptidase II